VGAGGHRQGPGNPGRSDPPRGGQQIIRVRTISSPKHRRPPRVSTDR
jgi:hypothetical protein